MLFAMVIIIFIIIAIVIIILKKPFPTSEPVASDRW